MNVKAKDIAKLIKEAKIDDKVKAHLILHLAAARNKMNDIEFTKLFKRIKERLEEQERMLN